MQTPLVNGSVGVVVDFQPSEDDSDGTLFPLVDPCLQTSKGFPRRVANKFLSKLSLKV